MMEDQLVEACEVGDLETVKQLVEQGADIHACHNRPLRFACANNNLHIVKYLLESGADINTRYGGFLDIVCELDFLSMVKYLVTHGASTVNIDASGYSEEIVNYLNFR